MALWPSAEVPSLGKQGETSGFEDFVLPVPPNAKLLLLTSESQTAGFPLLFPQTPGHEDKELRVERVCSEAGGLGSLQTSWVQEAFGGHELDFPRVCFKGIEANVFINPTDRISWAENTVFRTPIHPLTPVSFNPN